ncbi:MULTISPECIES: ParB N-terminal domain-containing protein [unclassified Enterococcus]|uniref:ParB N-terminal domain-containing protein n=1 Tax=unclassified Enterococcus TaxID=2608891 RepID=UPI003D2801D2
MSDSVGKIYITKEYDKFRKLRGHRCLKKNINLEKSIKKSGILIPIEVNGKFEIIDGQHRFVIAKKLKLYIPYRVSVGLDIEDVITLNSTSKSWTIMNFIDKYCVDNNQAYLRLKELAITYPKIPISSLASAAEGYLSVNSKTTAAIKNGNFCFYNYEMFRTLLTDYTLFLAETKIKSGQYVFFTFFNLYTLENFSFERLTNGIKKKINVINGNINREIILEEFLKAYNYGLEENNKAAIQYRINKNDKIVVMTNRNTILLKVGS